VAPPCSYVKLDQPNTALEHYQKASEVHPGETSLILGVARVHDMLNNLSQAVQFYKKARRPLRPAAPRPS
jgi:tetratricopeptide repeat protein 8